MPQPYCTTMREPNAPVYYDRRAEEYDDWYRGVGLFAERDRPGFDDELALVIDTLTSLEPRRTLDIACGTGFLTRHLPGEITGLDQSARMLAVAARQAPNATFIQGDGLELPFADNSFERVVSGHFYGHLGEGQRDRFLAETRRIASELVIVDASSARSPVSEEWASRVLNDGTEWTVYKRYFTPDQLLAEIGGVAETLLAGAWFLVARATDSTQT